MTTFAIGETAILQNTTYFTQWDGCLVVVVEGLGVRRVLDLRTRQHVRLLTYGVLPLVEGAIKLQSELYQLRKLPGNDAVLSRNLDKELEIPEEALET